MMENSHTFKSPKNLFAETKRQKQEGYKIEAQPIKNDSNESSVSDLSYESSVSSNEGKQSDKVQYFREEMSRFFINYPELLNDEILEIESNEKNLWGDLTSDIMDEAKEAPITLDAIAKRIAYYRRKSEQIDIIDLLINEKDSILQELQIQNDMLIQENINASKKNEDANRNSNSTENVYYSWKKRRQNDILNHTKKTCQRKSYSSLNNPKSFSNFKYPHKKDIIKTKYPRSSEKLGGKKKNSSKSINQPRNTLPPSQPKVMFNFEPQTQIGKQLCEEIKQHNPQDHLGIKKTIINFLSKYRSTLQDDIKKTNLSQKINKLYLQDSKQLLLFYPISKGKQTQMPLKSETDEFLLTLKEITEGPIMKYWKILQEKKL